MHILLFTLFAFIQNINLQAQNLVPNPSFEDTLHCPIGADDLSSTKFWYKPTGSSTDLLHSCDISNLVGVPNNYYGYQNAKTGNAYAGIIFSYDSVDLNYREYIQVKLTSALILGNKYFVSAYFAKADSTPLALKNMAIALSSNAIGGNYTTPINYSPQIVYAQFLTDTDWIEISDTIIANGGEEYLTIGYFNYNNLSDTMSLFYSQLNDKQAYYYVDDVSITNISLEINENILDKEIIIYSNNGIVSVQVNIPIEAKIEIYNLLGQMIDNKTILPHSNYSINLSDQPQGIYFFRINSNEIIITKKLFLSQ